MAPNVGSGETQLYIVIFTNFKVSSYAQLGEYYGSWVTQQKLVEPKIIHCNTSLARQLNCAETPCSLFSMLDNKGFATVYSGHQFGQWAGQLGDGRAMLLGELGDSEIALKGSGQTPYSRFGDGNAVLRSSIREYLASETLHQLNISSSRCLAIFSSEHTAMRDIEEPCALTVRTAKSFVRFGHFEHFYHNRHYDQVEQLADYCIKRLYPTILEKPRAQHHLLLFKAILQGSAQLVAQWQGFGFCHGVLNTDNLAISGETIDYGPYAFLECYNPDFICNSSDYRGRYSYAKQPEIVLWNCQALAECFTTLCHSEQLKSALAEFTAHYYREYYRIFAKRMGLGAETSNNNAQLIQSFLDQLQQQKLDFNQSFRNLADPNILQKNNIDKKWIQGYLKATCIEKNIEHSQYIKQNNPALILRNHFLREIIQSVEHHNTALLERAFQAIKAPYREDNIPPQWLESQIQTKIESCSS